MSGNVPVSRELFTITSGSQVKLLKTSVFGTEGSGGGNSPDQLSLVCPHYNIVGFTSRSNRAEGDFRSNNNSAVGMNIYHFSNNSKLSYFVGRVEKYMYFCCKIEAQ